MPFLISIGHKLEIFGSCSTADLLTPQI